MDSETIALAERLKHQCTKRKLTLGVAESLTAGRLQAAIASVDGASNYFVGGLTAYNLAQKVKQLGVDREHAASVDCVSDRVARDMAAGLRRRFGADVAASTTGYAGPWPARNIEEAQAYYAIDYLGAVTSGHMCAGTRSRTEVQAYVAQWVLRQLVERLEKEG